MTRHISLAWIPAVCLLMLATVAAAQTPDFNAELRDIQTAWTEANYHTPTGEARLDAFEKLVTRADDFAQRHPDRAEALIWDGIVLSTCAGVKGGLGALGLAKRSREKLEQALAINPTALGGSAHTSLGTLYHKVPGFPIGFGSDKKARSHLEAALQINPAGIDPNYFYGEFLYDEGEYAAAMSHLEKALRAPPRPGRESADEGRRQDIRALMAKLAEVSQ